MICRELFAPSTCDGYSNSRGNGHSNAVRSASPSHRPTCAQEFNTSRGGGPPSPHARGDLDTPASSEVVRAATRGVAALGSASGSVRRGGGAAASETTSELPTQLAAAAINWEWNDEDEDEEDFPPAASPAKSATTPAKPATSPAYVASPVAPPAAATYVASPAACAAPTSCTATPAALGTSLRQEVSVTDAASVTADAGDGWGHDDDGAGDGWGDSWGDDDGWDVDAPTSPGAASPGGSPRRPPAGSSSGDNFEGF